MFHEYDREGLQEMLEFKPSEISVQVAARAALRVLPLFEEMPGTDSPVKTQRVALAAFRAAQIAFAAGLWPDRGNRMYEVADSASSAHLEHSSYAADRASDAIDWAIGSVLAGYNHKRSFHGIGIIHASPEYDSQRAAHLASKVADVAVSDKFRNGLLEAAFDDAHILVKDRRGARIHRNGLWLAGRPDWVDDVTGRLESRLSDAGGDWGVWLRWYRAVLTGSPIDRNLEYEIAMIPREVWRRGPLDANAEIARLEAQHLEAGTRDRKEPEEVSSRPQTEDRPPQKKIKSSFGWGLGTGELGRKLVDIEWQLADLHDRLAQEIEVQTDARRNDPMHAKNIEFLEGLSLHVSRISEISKQLSDNPDPEETDTVNRQGRSFIDWLEGYAKWVVGDENARELANGVLIGGAATLAIQLNWSPLPVTAGAIALIGGPRLKEHFEKLVAQVKGAT